MKKNIDNSKINEPLTKSSNTFPVVGIGASAGGLDAFKKLIKAIPEDSGMAYVLVQHLDPKHESLLPELLQKVTTIPVLEILDDIKVQPNHIYILPSNKMMVANDGVLLLSPRAAARTEGDSINKNDLNLPIDLFFTSLAEVHQSHSIGVVLSGTASDGTKGLKAIKDQGGITFAQSEDSAAYNGMPHSAIEAGVVDFILAPGEIPKKLLEITSIINGNGTAIEDMPQQEADIFKQMLSLLRIRKGTDFTYYKQSTIRRRIFRRMAMNKSEEPAGYLKFLRENKNEQDVLYQDLLIPVTAFFRDAKSFEHLCETVFPQIIKDKKEGEPIRVWVAGCSTGQEVYSVAICLKEYLGEQKERVQIFATDISEPAIAKARHGIYLKSEVDGLTSQRVQEFFTKNNGSYQVNKSIRDMCVFALHNFLKDPPFGKMDLISCRNVLIYMEPYLQKKALTTFHYALNPKGFLLLGKSETTSSVPELFALSLSKDKIFSRKNVPGKYMHTATMRHEQRIVDGNINSKNDPDSQSVGTGRTDFQKTVDNIILSKYTPAGVVVNEAMDIVHFRGKTGNYLEQLSGKPTHNLLMMAKEGLAFELRNILHKAKKEKASIRKENIPVNINGGLHSISLEAVPLPNTIEPHYLVLFQENHQQAISPDRPGQSGGHEPSALSSQIITQSRIAQLEKELAQAREDMRSITEDQEAANEELQSANEELLSGSEELQSLNEELETGKEELQSTNEELTVVNQEMIDLNEQVTEARNYAEAIITTIREPMLVLDRNLRVKSANSAFYKTFQVNELETEGRLVYLLGDNQWNIPQLRTLLEEILPQQTMFADFEVTHHFQQIGDRVMLLNAREIFREKIKEKLILLAIEDVTEKATVRKKIEESEARFRTLMKELPIAVYSCDAQGFVNYYNNAAVKAWGREPEIGKDKWCGSWKLIKPDGSPLPLDSCPMTIAIKEGRSITGEEVIIERSDGTHSIVEVYPQPLFGLSGEIIGGVNIVIDVTEQKQAAKKIEESEVHFRQMANLMPAKITNANAEGGVTYCNKNWLEFTGCNFEEFKSFGYRNVMHPDELDEFQQRFLNASETGTVLEMEMRFKNRQGEYKWHLNRATPVKDENGNFKMWIGVTTEIQQQKEQTEKLEKAVKERTIELSGANEELIQKNQEITLSKYNKRFLSEYSEKFSAYKGHNEFFSSLVQFIADTTHLDYVFVGKLKHDSAGHYNIQTIALNAFGKPADNIVYPLPDGPCEQVIQGALYSYPERCRTLFPNNKTITQFKVEGYIGYPLYNEQGAAVGLIAVMHEKKIEDTEIVSPILKIVARRAEIELERIKNEELLVQHNKALQEKNQALGKLNKELESFTYISSHDLQEPLRKIKTFARLIIEKENKNLSEKGQDHFNRILNAANHMQTLIQDLLLYSQATSTHPNFEVTNLNEIVGEIKVELAEIIQEKNAVIHADNLSTVNVIPFQFRQLFSNLITNSLKFSLPETSPNIIIKTEIDTGSKFELTGSLTDKLSPQKKYFHITFTDNGIGFDMQYKDRIFEVFQRLHGKEEYTGTGIGLAIVKKIVDNHNGVITAVGELGKGATFNIYIPA